MWLDAHLIIPDMWISEFAFLPSKSSEYVLHIGVVSPRFGDGNAQLSVAQCPDGGDDARDDPDN